MDTQFFENKLKDYTEIQYSELKVGDHFRYTSSVYKEPDARKCCYAIVKKINEDNSLMVNGYKPTYSDWKLDPNNKYRQFKFYKRLVTGKCAVCFKPVQNYSTCYDCSKKN